MARSEYERELLVIVRTAYDDMISFLNETKMKEVEVNASQLLSSYVDEAKRTIQSDKTIHDLERSFRILVQDSFERRTDQEGLEVFHWTGDINAITEDLWNELRTLGEDPEQDQLPLYALTENFVSQAFDLADRTTKNATNGAYSLDSFQKALISALQGGSYEDEFERDVLEKEISLLIEGVAELFGARSVDADDSVHSTMTWIDNRLNDYSDGSVKTVPGKGYVAPLILANFALEKVSSCSSVLQGL